MDMALKGLKVLDFSTLLPGPFATMYLADLGAEVIHIESPTRPDLIRLMPPYANGQATAHSYLNRNKHAVALDLKDPANIELIKSKISDYDIVIEQFRPGVMQRLGLDYQTLSEINPRLIYCSITGYGQTGGYQIKQDTISTMWLCQGSRDIAGDSTVDHHQWGFKLRILQEALCIA